MSGILLLEIENWLLEVKSHGDGLQVAIIKGNKSSSTVYVRLDSEQSDTLREFLNELAVSSGK